MTKDFFAGVVISAALHFGLVSWGEKAPPPPPHPRPIEDTGCRLVMPPLDQDDPPVKVDDLPEDQPKQTLAPPMLPDVPTTVPVNSFIEPLTPPLPPGMTAPNSVTIPVNNPGTDYRRHPPGIFTMDQLNERPAARVQPQPAYPYAMSQAGLSGNVEVEFIIGATGDVIDARVIRSSNREFESSALAAVLKWKFKPGRRNGQAVKVRASQLLEFNLDQADR